MIRVLALALVLAGAGAAAPQRDRRPQLARLDRTSQLDDDRRARGAVVRADEPGQVILFDGEESPRGTSPSKFLQRGVRGRRAAVRRYRRARLLVLLDMVGDSDLAIRRERSSSPQLWSQRRGAGRRDPGRLSRHDHADAFLRRLR